MMSLSSVLPRGAAACLVFALAASPAAAKKPVFDKLFDTSFAAPDGQLIFTIDRPAMAGKTVAFIGATSTPSVYLFSVPVGGGTPDRARQQQHQGAGRHRRLHGQPAWIFHRVRTFGLFVARGRKEGRRLRRARCRRQRGHLCRAAQRRKGRQARRLRHAHSRRSGAGPCAFRRGLFVLQHLRFGQHGGVRCRQCRRLRGRHRGQQPHAHRRSQHAGDDPHLRCGSVPAAGDQRHEDRLCRCHRVRALRDLRWAARSGARSCGSRKEASSTASPSPSFPAAISTSRCIWCFRTRASIAPRSMASSTPRSWTSIRKVPAGAPGTSFNAIGSGDNGGNWSPAGTLNVVAASTTDGSNVYAGLFSSCKTNKLTKVLTQGDTLDGVADVGPGAGISNLVAQEERQFSGRHSRRRVPLRRDLHCGRARGC